MLSINEVKEGRYRRFVSLYELGWGVDKIAECLGLTLETIKGENYVMRYNNETGDHAGRTIDRVKMFDLIHQIERKYRVGGFENGHTIRFTDEFISNDEPLMIELHKVVGVL